MIKPALKESTRQLHAEILQQVSELKAQGMRQYDIAKKLGITPSYLSQLKAAYGLTHLAEESVNQGIDLSKITNYWVKSKHVSIHVKGGESVSYEDVRDDLIAEMKKHAPKYERVLRKSKNTDHLLIIDPADVHIGKLATLSSTGGEYNHNIAVDRLVKGVDGVVTKATGFGIERVMLVIGNDILHVDTPNATTTKGTRLDMSLPWHDAFKLARKIYVQTIEKLLTVADVNVVFNPSNHDYISGFMLADALECWFHTSKNITFDNSIRDRKYTMYGNNLICTSHGDGAKERDLPLVMAQEAPKLWAEAEHRHIYLHHIHHKKKIKYNNGQDYIGVTIEYLRSPSDPDEWHYKNGYVGAKKAIEGFVHHVQDGRVASFSHYF